MKAIKFSRQAKSEFDEIVAKYPQKQAAMLPTLYLAEKEFGHISPEVEVYVGELLDVPPVKVREVLTFYTLFARKPRGKYHFQVCRGLSCDLVGCLQMIDYLESKLEINVGEIGESKEYELSVVECLGACETGPMMQLNEDYHGNLTPYKIDEILKTLK